jgi:hypothetical protein
MPSRRGFGFQNRNFGGFSPGKEVLKTIFKLRWPGLPHNLGYILWGSDAGDPEPINREKTVQLQPALTAGKDVVELAFFRFALDQDKYDL